MRLLLGHEVQPFLRAPIPRQRFMLDICRHQVVVAPTRWGEITYRHGEALASDPR